MERELEGDALRPARLTVDLFRAVPMRPLAVRTERVRDARRIKVVQASICDGATEVARASGLFLLGAEMPAVPAWAADAMPGPDGFESVGIFRGAATVAYGTAFHATTDVRWVTSLGAAQAGWFRLPMALVDGEVATPFQRVAALGDYASAVVSMSMRRRDEGGVPFLNTDMTHYFSRLPEGEWIGLVADHHAANDGIGVAEVVLHDARGRFGRSVHARILMPAPPGAAPKR